MDIATLGGLIVCLLCVVVGVFAAGIGFLDLYNTASIFITFGGSAAAVIMSNPLPLSLGIGKVYRKAFNVPVFDVKSKIVQLVQFFRKSP